MAKRKASTAAAVPHQHQQAATDALNSTTANFTTLNPTTANPDMAHSEEEVCPVCKSDRYLNPSLQLLVSPCYHRVCSSCVERLFSQGSAPCPVCQTPLRKAHFTVPLYEDLLVEKECRIRRRLAAIFNKREDDFLTARDYNDYLEEVEEIVWNLVQDVDIKATSDKLEAYRQQNLEQIARNKERAEHEASQAKQRLAEEERQRLDYDSLILAEIEAEQLERRDNEQRFIEELAGRKTVGRESKRRAQAAAIQEMPSLRGLRTNAAAEASASARSIDPFETVPSLVYALPVPEHVQFEPWFYGSRVPDAGQLAAGGVNPLMICRQVLLASCTF